MTKTVLTYLILALSLCWSTGVLAQNPKLPMSNRDVVQMLADGLANDVVIAAISANDVSFDVSPAGLLQLKKAEVGDKVVQAMLAAEGKKREAAAQRATAAAAQQPGRAQMEQAQLLRTNPALATMGMPTSNPPVGQSPAQLPKVTFIAGEKRQPMEPSVPEIASGKGKGGSAAGSTLKGFGKGLLVVTSMTGAPVPRPGSGRGGLGMPNVARSWALPGRNSAFTLPAGLPKFEIEFADIPGVDPDAYEPVLVKLIQTKDNWRLVSSSKDKFDKHGNDTRSVKIKNEEKIPVNITALGRGHVAMAPSSDLAAGEYGLVLHPKKDEKEYAGIRNANADAIFYSVWDFSVAAGR
jgi:hypothetical protein